MCTHSKIGESMASVDVGVVRRGVPRVSGIYVKGSVESVDIVYTVDTGASATLLSSRIFHEISEKKRPMLVTENCSRFRGPSGGTIPVLGQATFDLYIGDVHISKRITVADIQDDCLLGSDILLALEEGPFDFHLSENRLVWNGFSVPCIQVKQPSSTKIACATDCTIEGYSEHIVDAKLVSGSSLIAEESEIIVGDVLIEPCPSFHDKHKLLMASSLGRVHGDRVVKVRVMNPFPQAISIRRGVVMGEANPFSEVIQLLDEESNSTENFHVARRLQMSSMSQSSTTEVVDSVTPSSKEVPSHVKSLFEKTVENVSEAIHDDVAQLFNDFGDTFSKDDDDLGCTHLTSHSIDTGEARPIKQAPRRTPAAFEGRDKEALDKMLSRGTIRESNSPWASPVVLVAKKNGSVRVCVDYRRVNDLTKKDAFPLPKISDCLDAVSGSVYFSTLDLTSGYNQVPVAEEDIPKTAFVTKYGLFECPYMPFGLSNAPATFQRVMELALQGLQWATCLIYIDDVIVFGGSEGEHLTRLRDVLGRLQMANLKVKPEKCHF